MPAWGDEFWRHEAIGGPPLESARRYSQLFRGLRRGHQRHAAIMLEIVSRYSIRVVLLRDQ